MQSMDEEVFSASDEEERGGDPSRGLGRWLKVVKPEKRSFEKPGKTGAMENIS